MKQPWLFYLAFGIILPSTAMAEAPDAVYDAKGRRDPFVPIVTTSTKASTVSGLVGIETLDEIVVEGVMLDADPKKSVTIVNGSVLHEADEVGNVKVLKIKAEGAVISVNGIEGFKPLYQPEEKTAGVQIT